MAQQVRSEAADWLELSDDELVHRVQMLARGHGKDRLLLEIVGSARHFFVRQVAAKKIEDSKLLHEHWDDRQIGQILVRGLTRAEDMAYLEKLRAESRYTDVKETAGAQLAAIEEHLKGG
jgi:hypothetical protein